jgi:MFS transporter, NNP family, nitrate/nitrite transporter
MAEGYTSNIGNDNAKGAAGESMRGVTGRETLFDTHILGTHREEGEKGEEPLFLLPVDSEHKARSINILSFGKPHMRAFHLAWFAFFLSFCSAFAAPPLLPVIRDNLNLTKANIGQAGIAAVLGAIMSRLAMGTVCDMFGPRYGTAFLLMATVPCTASMAAVTDATGFIICRFFIGFVLALFVSCQYWMSSMFSTNVVGTANAITAGWGNMGGGAVQLVMPLLYQLISGPMGSPSFTAWRISFFIPAFFQCIVGVGVLVLGQDDPDGQYIDLHKKGERKMDQPWTVFLTAMKNYRTWVFVLAYGYSFGVELTVDNMIAEYFFDHFGLNLTTAGLVAASFGLMNIFSRPSGGMLSDVAGRYFGMRGRLWNLWVLQTLGGVFCMVLGRMENLGWAIAVMLIFSYFCQAACGATFGVIPFVSRRALGIVSGFTGAGGNAGSAITQAIFFTSGTFTPQEGIFWMGLMTIGCTLPILLVWFPQWGGMVFPAASGPSATEEAYYSSEYSKAEQADGRHERSLKFAANSRSERGKAYVAEDPTLEATDGDAKTVAQKTEDA